MSKKKVDYYQILEIDSSADLETVRNAYRNLAKKYHPDTCKTLSKKEAEERIKLINEAYSMLSDPGKRENYDNMCNSSGGKKNSSENVSSRSQYSSWDSSDYHYQAYGNNSKSYMYTPDKKKQLVSKILIIAKISAAVLLAVAFIAIGIIADKASKKDALQQKNSDISQEEPPIQRSKYFTLGSSKQKVIDVMGSPDEYNDYTYEYDYSSVYFNKNGIVCGWNNVDNRLKVFMGYPDNDQIQITVGKSKLEVIRAMGTPTFINGNIWRYGNASILFDSKERVKALKNINTKNR